MVKERLEKKQCIGEILISMEEDNKGNGSWSQEEEDDLTPSTSTLQNIKEVLANHNLGLKFLEVLA